MTVQKNADGTYSITTEKQTTWGMRTFRVQADNVWAWNTAAQARRAMAGR